MSDFQLVPGSPGSVREFYRLLLEPGFGRVTNATDLECRPGGGEAAFTAHIRTELKGVPRTVVRILDLATGGVRPVGPDEAGQQSSPRWSPDGTMIAYLSAGQGLAELRVVAADGGGAPEQIQVPGHSAEQLEWFPDGRRLLVLAAEEGASAGVLSGSGTVGADSDRQDWEPLVHLGGQELAGWRRAFEVELEGGGSRQISPPSLNVWDCCLAGDGLVVVASTQPFEGSWADSRLLRVPLDGGPTEELLRPRGQMGRPCAPPDGQNVAVVEAVCSDRGLVAGQVVLLARGGEPVRLDAQGVDATWVAFRGPGHLCLGGVRGTRTVFQELELGSNRWEQHLDTEGTTSDRHYPAGAVLPGGGLLLSLEEWRRAPRLVQVKAGSEREILSLATPGTDWLAARLGPVEEVTWSSRDGLQVSGILTRPSAGPGPWPTVLSVHGGPVWSARARWCGNFETEHALLTLAGFAILQPNPRGSTGWGREFVESELGDYGGGEVDDLLSGLDLLVERGVADPDRLGVYGVSHGGYMSCWITTRTDRFRAAVAGSPVADWYSQHFGSNIPEFDQLFVGGSPLAPGGAYFERSPVFFAHRSRTPTLLSAGLVDRCTPPGQAEEFHQALLAAGVPTELAIYPKEGHGIRQLEARIDFQARMTGHLARYLLPG